MAICNGPEIICGVSLSFVGVFRNFYDQGALNKLFQRAIDWSLMPLCLLKLPTRFSYNSYVTYSCLDQVIHLRIAVR